MQGGKPEVTWWGLLENLLKWAPLCLPALSSFLLPGSVGRQLEGVSASPGGLVKTPVAGPHLQVSGAAGLGWVPGFAFLTSSQVAQMLRL